MSFSVMPDLIYLPAQPEKMGQSPRVLLSIQDTHMSWLCQNEVENHAIHQTQAYVEECSTGFFLLRFRERGEPFEGEHGCQDNKIIYHLHKERG